MINLKAVCQPVQRVALTLNQIYIKKKTPTFFDSLVKNIQRLQLVTKIGQLFLLN